MTDSDPQTGTEEAAVARAAEQARLRKERREARIKSGGTARLNKITGLGGGLQRGRYSHEPSLTLFCILNSVSPRCTTRATSRIRITCFHTTTTNARRPGRGRHLAALLHSEYHAAARSHGGG